MSRCVETPSLLCAASMTQLTRSFRCQTGLLTLLVAGLSQHSSIASAAAKGQAQLDAVAALESCHRAVADLATLVEAGQLRNAVDRLSPVSELLERTTPAWIRATRVWQAEKVCPMVAARR